MPILTTANLETRSRQARFAIDHCTAPPNTAAELHARIAARPKEGGTRAVAFVFGPVEATLRATSYGPLFAVGVTDHEEAPSVSLVGPVGLRSIEQVLGGLLDEFSETFGYDVVLATVPTAAETWPAGLKTDYHLRECYARAGRTARAEGLHRVWYARG